MRQRAEVGSGVSQPHHSGWCAVKWRHRGLLEAQLRAQAAASHRPAELPTNGCLQVDHHGGAWSEVQVQTEAFEVLQTRDWAHMLDGGSNIDEESRRQAERKPL